MNAIQQGKKVFESEYVWVEKVIMDDGSEAYEVFSRANDIKMQHARCSSLNTAMWHVAVERERIREFMAPYYALGEQVVPTDIEGVLNILDDLIKVEKDRLNHVYGDPDLWKLETDARVSALNRFRSVLIVRTSKPD